MRKSKKTSTIELAYAGLSAVIMAVCSWISLPTEVPFTLQTFGVFCTLAIFGGRVGTLSVLAYLLVGAVGVPVFSGFTSGIGILLGATGGYMIGFVFMSLIYWLITAIFGNKLVVTCIAMILGNVVCYAFGTAWFMAVYAQETGAIGLGTALGWCVVPFIIPDFLKIALAVFVGRRASKYVRR